MSLVAGDGEREELPSFRPGPARRPRTRRAHRPLLQRRRPQSQIRTLPSPCSDPARIELRQAMLDHYLPRQGPAFETWLDQADPVAARIDADKMFTYGTND